ncbi:uncharacterized protein BJX67DRAFT_368548 [Aspergillus lucknowensis]|uniref:F-box domain-containing protein n=1 Tax=Aspergillus lucknowensis TaxID=176173 RepID=A0ABR4L663_9EURO
MDRQIPGLQGLPMEILHLILAGLHSWQITSLSLVNRRLREVCLPVLFHKVGFSFSEAGLNGLQQLANSPVRWHVRSLTYTVPELIKPDVLTFEIFKSEMLTPESYVEEAKELYGCGYPADECPPYMVIYETLRTICENQQGIMEEHRDIDILSSVLAALPRLIEMELNFCQSIDEPQWVDSYLSRGMTAKEISNIHHLQTLTKALQKRSELRDSLVTIKLSSMELPYYSPRETPRFPGLSGALECLLELFTALRITGSSAPLELLSHTIIKLRQLILGHVTIPFTTLREILQTNRQTIVSLGFYDTRLLKGDALSEIHQLSPKLLPAVLHDFSFDIQKSTDYWTVPYGETGWIVWLGPRYAPQVRGQPPICPKIQGEF